MTTIERLWALLADAEYERATSGYTITRDDLRRAAVKALPDLLAVVGAAGNLYAYASMQAHDCANDAPNWGPRCPVAAYRAALAALDAQEEATS